MASTEERTGPPEGPSVEHRRPGRDRVHREPLTRERILRAGLRVMDAEGLEALTMRRLGRELGVEAMSLYNHVRDKEDLLDGITELVMSEIGSPSTSTDWVEQARAAAHEWRRVLNAHPSVVRLLAERNHPMTSASALRPMEHALDILRRAGLSGDEAVRAFQAVGGYIFGFVLMEVGNLLAERHPKGSFDDAEALARLNSNDELPRLAELAPHFAECDMDETFDFGLELLLEGLQGKIRRSEPT